MRVGGKAEAAPKARPRPSPVLGGKVRELQQTRH